MATAIAISTANRLSWSLSDAPTLGSAGEMYETSTTRTVANGTGSLQANAAWADLVTIPAGQVLSLDITNLSTAKFGIAGHVAFSTIKDVFVINKETTAGRYVLYGVASPSDVTGYAARINRGGEHRWTDYVDGISVNAGNKTIYIANPGADSVTLEIAICGVGTYVSN